MKLPRIRNQCEIVFFRWEKKWYILISGLIFLIIRQAYNFFMGSWTVLSISASRKHWFNPPQCVTLHPDTMPHLISYFNRRRIADHLVEIVTQFEFNCVFASLDNDLVLKKRKLTNWQKTISHSSSTITVHVCLR